MKPSCFFLILSSTALAFAQDTSLTAAKNAFDAVHIPANLSLPFNPKVLLEVTFVQPTGGAITLHAGMRLLKNATIGPLVFGFVGRSPSKGPFVIASVDLDSPTPQKPTLAQVRHFLGGNFFLDSGYSKQPGILSNHTPAVSRYLEPRPQNGSDPHRYVFLIFDQSKVFNKQTLVNANTSIFNFNISSFAQAVKLGPPIGGTFMLVGPDPSTA